MKRSSADKTRVFYAAVGQRIATARAGKITQEALASRAALTRTSIINIEKGRQQVFLHTLIDIAQALSVPVTDLIPATGGVEAQLRDKTQKGVEWVKTSAAALKD